MTNTEEKKYRNWIVETSDRGTVEVTCAPVLSKSEVLDRIPNAVKAKPKIEKKPNPWNSYR